jgi:predicted phosphate transport protein (TIGR00153 family)
MTRQKKNRSRDRYGKRAGQYLRRIAGDAAREAHRNRPFFSAAVAGDWEEAREVRNEIEALEQEADDLKKKIRLNLPKSLFMPVPREDLLELLLVQDKIANRTRDVSSLIGPGTFPGSCWAGVCRFRSQSLISFWNS